MVKKIETYMVCDDCLMAIANGDLSALSLLDETEAKLREKAIYSGIDRIQSTVKGGCLVAGDETEEFSWNGCECCLDACGGRRHSVTLIGTEPK